MSGYYIVYLFISILLFIFLYGVSDYFLKDDSSLKLQAYALLSGFVCGGGQMIISINGIIPFFPQSNEFIEYNFTWRYTAFFLSISHALFASYIFTKKR